MDLREVVVAALASRFGDRGVRFGTTPDPTAVFPAKHPAVGDASLWIPPSTEGSKDRLPSARVTVGDILVDEFYSLDVHLPFAERAERVTKEVVRFFDHLLTDRLVFWRSRDERQSRGWRECRDATHREPLVIDDRTYDVYLWSGPLPPWRATAAILARRAIRDQREYEILLTRLSDPGAGGLEGPDRALAQALIADFEDRQPL